MKHMFTAIFPKIYNVTLSRVSRIRFTFLHPTYVRLTFILFFSLHIGFLSDLYLQNFLL